MIGCWSYFKPEMLEIKKSQKFRWIRSGQIITARFRIYILLVERAKNSFQFSIFCRHANLEKVVFSYKLLTQFSTLFSCLYLQYDNVEACLDILRHNSVPGVENVTTNDIIGGRLKAVLSLFFSLSRFKQASKLKVPINKQLSASHPHHSQNDMHATR